ncbi:MAG: DUF192 domain-containing protein [Schleiferiaceae bacterium]|nr:DUF192 domain-containing protein [Schleiferiaceae bacterium]
MNAFRKYAVWIVGLGLAAFIIPSVVGSIGKFGSNTKPSVKQPSQPYEPPFRVDGSVWAVNGSDTATVFETEYATTSEAIEIGMMYRRSTPPNRAMLFFMPGGDQPRSFWMKNTLVSLDIIYINSNHEVVSIQANAEPRSTKSLPSAAPASYVLEVLGGQAAAQGIVAGTKIYWSSNDAE